MKQIAENVNLVISGWLNYYTKFSKSECWEVMKYLNARLSRWVKRKYKRFKGKAKLGKAYDWLVVHASHDRTLFSHWANGFIPYQRKYILK